MAAAQVRVPSSAKKGEVIEIKTRIQHDMETGMRKDSSGKTVPRLMLKSFVCKYNGATVFEADFDTSVSANPILSFFTVATESGKLEFIWTDDNNVAVKEEASITVA
ncbi:MAG: thiosulfate oxidation carrier complex protein SoxZ [Alphaproteobacteria bacterium]|nr:thiosulfate oxidation carrier complex protein SoxZ [Alphaproteobacteria bacterium]